MCEESIYFEGVGHIAAKDLQMPLVDFIAHAHHIAWVAYQIAVGQDYNIEPTEEQLTALRNGVKFHIVNPDATPEENHENWMKCKTEQGWVYGEVKDFEKKTHPDMVPFEDMLEVEKKKDIMDNTVRKAFSALYDAVLEHRS